MMPIHHDKIMFYFSILKREGFLNISDLEEFHWRVKERKKKEKRSQRKYEKVFLFCLIRLKVSERMSQNVAVSEMAEESPPESLRDSERIPWDNIPIFTLLYGSIKKKYLCKRERKREREREKERERERGGTPPGSPARIRCQEEKKWLSDLKL